MKYILPNLHENAGVGHTWLNWMAGRVLVYLSSNTKFIHTPINAPRSGGSWDSFLNFGSGFKKENQISYENTVSLKKWDFSDQKDIKNVLRKIENVSNNTLIKLSHNQFPGLLLNYTTELRDELRNFYWEDHSRNEEKSIVIHIRRGDIGPEQNKGRWVSNKKYKKFIGSLKERYGPSFRYDIVSEGDEKDFSEFSEFSLNYCLNENDKRSFHRMANAEILVTGLSTYSILSAVLSYGKIYYIPLQTKAANFTGWMEDVPETTNILKWIK